MKEFKINNHGKGRLFSNDFLERLTRTHFAYPVILYFIFSATCIGYSIVTESISILDYVWLFITGYFTFTLIEYLIHRYLFHFSATTTSELELQYKIHGVHHEFPRDKDRLVMPILVSVVLAVLFYLLFTFLMGIYGRLFFAGFISGYSVYLLIHYAIHALKPPDNFFKYYWKHHSLHHYASVESAFSVSFPPWDYIFGTMPPETTKQPLS